MLPNGFRICTVDKNQFKECCNKLSGLTSDRILAVYARIVKVDLSIALAAN